MANGEAIGLIETKGIVAAVEALDAALKAANVTFVEQHKVGSGLVAITLKVTWRPSAPPSMPAPRPAAASAKSSPSTSSPARTPTWQKWDNRDRQNSARRLSK